MTRSKRRIAVFDINNCYVSLNADGFDEIAEKIQAERAAWRSALGVMRGFRIPEKPIPAGRTALEVELAIVTQQLTEAFRAMEALPPGQERQSQAFAMVSYRERRCLLLCALRDDGGVE